MKGPRSARVAEEIREELATILAGEADDPRLRAATVNSVEVSSDLRRARVLLASPGPEHDPKDVLRAVRKAAGYLRHQLAQILNLRRMPELVFEFDAGAQNAERIETLLGRITKGKGRALSGILIVGLLWSAIALRSEEPPKPERYEASASIMGSVYRIAAFGPKRGVLASVIGAAFDEGRRIDAVLSNYREDSELSGINRRAAAEAVEVTPEMGALLAKCLDYSRVSDGAFDVTVGPLMKLWGFYRGDGKVPGSYAIARARRTIGYQNIEYDAAKRTVRFKTSGVEIDPGGIGKGYAVDRMAAILRDAGIGSAMISAGSSSMYAIGAPPDEPRGWHVRIRDPKDADVTAAELYLKDQSLSTSGSYEKFFVADGKTYSHIMDPRTGMPSEGVVAVSVLAPKTLDSEAWTKAFFVNGVEWSRRNRPKDFFVFLCSSGGRCGWVGAQPAALVPGSAHINQECD